MAFYGVFGLSSDHSLRLVKSKRAIAARKELYRLQRRPHGRFQHINTSA